MLVAPVGHLRKIKIIAAVDALGGLLAGARSPDEALEQGRAGKAIRAVQTGARDFADGAQAIYGRAAPRIGGDSAATVMRRGNDGDRLARHVDSALDADGVNARKTLAKLVGGFLRDVEIDARLARFEHGLINRARGNVARSERTGGMKPLHEFLALAIHEPAAFAAHRLRNQEAAVRGQERRRMELDVLQVDAARPGAIGHGDAVAARARRIRRVQKDAAEAARRQNGFPGENGENFSGGLVEHVCSNTGQRAVDVGGLDRVVRRRQQVHRSGICEHFHFGVSLHPFKESPLNRKSGLVLEVNDPRNRMAGLGCQIEFAADFPEKDRTGT